MNVITQRQFLKDPDGSEHQINEPPPNSVILWRTQSDALVSFQRDRDGLWKFPGLSTQYEWEQVKIFIYGPAATLLAVISA